MKQEKNNDLPKNAKRVFEGMIFDVYQWEQKMFDGSTAIFERIERPDTAVAIAVVGDKIIIQEQQQPDGKLFLSVPSGRCEKGEKTMETIKRELLEETGYTSRDIVFWKRVKPFTKIMYKIDYFIARDCKFIQKPQLDSGEKIKNKMIDFEEFLMLSEDQIFYDRELKNFLFRMRLHPEEKEEFKKLLFKK